ncbi:MAG: hypothetical protein ACRCVH_10425 [Vagococcus fluvialis]|uniref:hypothetical protein n=1 Tax=Vagococcus fluvialis TaxID=2738 RepID=UPI000B6F0BD6|nr:hypothetical protein [Vagococcus fluvialis]MBO0419729.1 hypothetical protein [Vagococcus fluvialis]OTP29195.1 hypothetical protein A5798_002363 [Enterococcus sp. 6C8_DIV0013]
MSKNKKTPIYVVALLLLGLIGIVKTLPLGPFKLVASVLIIGFTILIVINFFKNKNEN